MAVQRKGDDLAFSDTDGNGKINELDTIAIHQNMLKTHEIAEPTATKPFSYKYDDNGNMVYDQYKNLNINYNILNLPDTLSVTGQGKIVNQYLADGTLLRRSFFDKDDNELRRIDYQGEFLFVNGKLDKVFTEEGYYQPTSALAAKSSPLSEPVMTSREGAGGGNRRVKKSDYGTYFYTLKDHLGHTRVVVDEEENVIQETAYYPYGGIIADLSTKNKYNYLYTGKEFIDSLGVNWYDYHARYYDPEVGRWFAIDPSLQAASPYMAMGNNPMIYIDADGRTWKIFEKIGDVAEGAWDGFWMVANDIRKWGESLGINSFNAGVNYNSQG
ncbi:RHS repeat-associated core domain-containing protein [Marinifilum fragile]|uniref:RHS repeat domain-containing protein n=1 Tax=Marinifilum fragile TaxID=570161 RepID=UPI002AA721DB|nr:RHS repeat-associated core domain-containing protein [Marinifilum fragile]